MVSITFALKGHLHSYIFSVLANCCIQSYFIEFLDCQHEQLKLIFKATMWKFLHRGRRRVFVLPQVSALTLVAELLIWKSISPEADVTDINAAATGREVADSECRWSLIAQQCLYLLCFWQGLVCDRLLHCSFTLYCYPLLSALWPGL